MYPGGINRGFHGRNELQYVIMCNVDTTYSTHISLKHKN